MRVEVTRQCIERGKRSYAYGCPIALALRSVGEASVSMHSVLVEEQQFMPSDRVATWISRFDAGQPAEPFTLVLQNGEARYEG